MNSRSVPSFNAASRLLVFAPHPDDESLACGILLQNAVEAGAAILVIYVTDGENNPWPQRYLSRRWRLNAAARQRWAKLRRKEALAALLERYDHYCLNDLPDFEGIPPSTENVARRLGEALAQRDFGRARVHRVEVWETPIQAATYYLP